MVEIKYKFHKKGILIFSKAKVLSSDFRKWFLIELTKIFDLYEDRIFENKINFLTAKIIENSTYFSPSEIEEYRKLYSINKSRGESFENFLELFKFGFATIYVFPKGVAIKKDEKLKETKAFLAIIELEVHGDDCIWITTESSVFTKLVDEYNNKNK